LYEEHQNPAEKDEDAEGAQVVVAAVGHGGEVYVMSVTHES
jgi:hypothetical protein